MAVCKRKRKLIMSTSGLKKRMGNLVRLQNLKVPPTATTLNLTFWAKIDSSLNFLISGKSQIWESSIKALPKKNIAPKHLLAVEKEWQTSWRRTCKTIRTYISGDEKKSYGMHSGIFFCYATTMENVISALSLLESLRNIANLFFSQKNAEVDENTPKHPSSFIKASLC